MAKIIVDGHRWRITCSSVPPQRAAGATTLPSFLFALPAGSIGDIVDRRRLILHTEAWMVCVAAVLAAATFAGIVTPWLLLALTFALSAGDAVETPTWRAVLSEVVAKEDLPAASALTASSSTWHGRFDRRSQAA